MKIITVTGYKGGVGKSTTALHLADYFSKFGDTILIDHDLNMCAVDWFERADSQISFEVVEEKLALKRIGEGADFVVMDMPARPHTEDIKSLSKGCDLIVLPSYPDRMSLMPLFEVMNDIDMSIAKILLTLVPPSPNKLGVDTLTDLKNNKIPVFDTFIRRSVAYSKAYDSGMTVRLLSESRDRSFAEDYEAVGKSIRSILNGEEEYNSVSNGKKAEGQN